MTPPSRFGLCDSCAHQRLIRSGRGSSFSMCEIGLRDPDWPKYPRMPVLACPRFDAQRVSSTDRRASTS